MTALDILKEYSSLISAGLSLAALGFLVHIANLIRNAAKDKIEVLEARNNAIQKEFEAKKELLDKENQIIKYEAERIEKLYSLQIENLRFEIDKNKEQLKVSFSQADISLETLVSQSSEGITEKVKQSLENHISELLVKVEKINELKESVSPDVYLEMGKGLMAIREWKEAAEQFDKYVGYYPLNWEVQFLKALSYANSRGGKDTNILSLRAYNETIALMPETEEIDENLKARLFSYRGAMLKRLGRIDEAEADLIIAQKLASGNYEIRDIKYNLACVFAARKDKAGLIETIQSLKKHDGYEAQLRAIKWHRQDYFSAFADDEDFLRLIDVT
jgi:hypothetical protein